MDRARCGFQVLQQEANSAGLRDGVWCGPAVVARLTGLPYSEAAASFQRLDPGTYPAGKEVSWTFTHHTRRILERTGVVFDVLNAREVVAEGQVQDNHVFEDKSSKLTLTRVLRRLDPGLYVVKISRHIMLVDRRPGYVYDTKQPCCFIYDNCFAGLPVGRGVRVVNGRRVKARWGASQVYDVWRVKSAPAMTF
jgi:hypothetical protein